MIRLLAIGLTACACSLGCGGGTPDKAAIEKKIRDGLAQKTEWKDVTFEMKLDGKLTTAGAHREIDGQKYWFNFTGGDGTGGVAVRKTDGTLLCKYLYEGSKETSASKLDGGKDEDILKFRAAAGEFAAVCLAASS